MLIQVVVVRQFGISYKFIRVQYSSTTSTRGTPELQYQGRKEGKQGTPTVPAESSQGVRGKFFRARAMLFPAEYDNLPVPASFQRVFSGLFGHLKVGQLIFGMNFLVFHLPVLVH